MGKHITRRVFNRVRSQFQIFNRITNQFACQRCVPLPITIAGSSMCFCQYAIAHHTIYTHCSHFNRHNMREQCSLNAATHVHKKVGTGRGTHHRTNERKYQHHHQHALISMDLKSLEKIVITNGSIGVGVQRRVHREIAKFDVNVRSLQ